MAAAYFSGWEGSSQIARSDDAASTTRPVAMRRSVRPWGMYWGPVMNVVVLAGEVRGALLMAFGRPVVMSVSHPGLSGGDET